MAATEGDASMATVSRSRRFEPCRKRHDVVNAAGFWFRCCVQALTLGYENVSVHDELRLDPALALACGREESSTNAAKRSRGVPLPGKCFPIRLGDCGAAA